VDKRIQNFAKVLEDGLHRKADGHVALASQVDSCVLFSVSVLNVLLCVRNAKHKGWILKCSPVSHLNMAVQEKVLVVGRICCDAEGHLNDNSVLLEGR
jgi:hypothetical protein